MVDRMSDASADRGFPGPEDAGSSPFERRLRALLEQVAGGSVSTEKAVEALRDLPFADLGFARVDHHRELRQGSCEIVFAQGKTVQEVSGIVDRLLEGNVGPIMVTRADAAHRDAVRGLARVAGLPVEERPRSGAIAVIRGLPSPTGRVLMVTAGTADLPVADEAVLTARLMGAEVELIAD